MCDSYLGGGHHADAGEEASPLAVASAGSEWAPVRPRGTLVSEVWTGLSCCPRVYWPILLMHHGKVA